jgi:hypothetical protein
MKIGTFAARSPCSRLHPCPMPMFSKPCSGKTPMPSSVPPGDRTQLRIPNTTSESQTLPAGFNRHLRSSAASLPTIQWYSPTSPLHGATLRVLASLNHYYHVRLAFPSQPRHNISTPPLDLLLPPSESRHAIPSTLHDPDPLRSRVLRECANDTRYFVGRVKLHIACDF